MQEICDEIKTCIAGAEMLLQSGKKVEAKALYKSAYQVAKKYGTEADRDVILNALLKFFQSGNQREADLEENHRANKRHSKNSEAGD